MKDALGVLAVLFVIFGFAICFAIGLIWVPINGVGYGYSEGERTGDVYKFSYKGILWKSWEGEMYLGGVTSDRNGGLQVEKFQFSIPAGEADGKKDLIAKINQCVQTRTKHCTIVYKQWFMRPAYIESEYDVVDVKVE